jgi:hypothetical protein
MSEPVLNNVEGLAAFVNNTMMKEIDVGHEMLADVNGDLSAALSVYCIDILSAADSIAARVEGTPDEEHLFDKGMAESYCRVVMALTGLLMAYDDKSQDNDD